MNGTDAFEELAAALRELWAQRGAPGAGERPLLGPARRPLTIEGAALELLSLERIARAAAAADLVAAQWRDVAAKALSALQYTREYVGAETLPALPGWDWIEAVRAIQNLLGVDVTPFDEPTPPPAHGREGCGVVYAYVHRYDSQPWAVVPEGWVCLSAWSSAESGLNQSLYAKPNWQLSTDDDVFLGVWGSRPEHWFCTQQTSPWVFWPWAEPTESAPRAVLTAEGMAFVS